MKQVERITSRDNRRLINVRKVRDGKVDGSIFIEGRRLVEEALRSDLLIEECFFTGHFVASKTGKDLIDAISQETTNIAEVTDRTFESMVDTTHSQGIVLIAQRPRSSAAAIVDRLNTKENRMRIVIFLNEINNPSNLGAIMRTAEAAGVCGVVVSKNSADVFSPKALRAAMGASFRLPVWENAEFYEVLEWAKKGKLTTTAADIKGVNSFTNADWTRPRLLIFGSEAHGLNEQDHAKIEEVIGIPMENQVESLNLAVSAGIILFEAKRQNS